MNIYMIITFAELKKSTKTGGTKNYYNPIIMYDIFVQNGMCSYDWLHRFANHLFADSIQKQCYSQIKFVFQ